MSIVPAALLLLSAGFPQAGMASSAQDASDTDVLVTANDAANRLTVGVKLGEHGPFPFMIDTGAQNTVIANTLVSRLALISKARAKLISVAGFTTVDTVELDEVVLGRRSFYGLIAPVLLRSDIGADGILGLDSLQDQRVLIDFRKGLMAVGDARTLGGDGGFQIVVTARRKSGQLIMTDATLNGVRVNVVIDTGSDTTLGNRALQLALGRKGRATTPTELRSVTGQSLAAEVGYASDLKLPGATITSVVIAYSDSPTFAYLGLDKKPTLLLGMRELRVFPRVAIDFKTRKILFQLPRTGDPDYFYDVAPMPPAAPTKPAKPAN